jgi:GSH-dependent disulfide-bond oxidoreductase
VRLISRLAAIRRHFYSIANIATSPLARYEWHKTDLNQFPNVKRWFDEIRKGPAMQRGMVVPS